MMIPGRVLGAVGGAAFVAGGVTSFANEWRSPIRPSVGSVDLMANMALGAAPGIGLLYGASWLSSQAARTGVDLLGVAATGFGMGAATVGYFNWMRD